MALTDFIDPIDSDRPIVVEHPAVMPSGVYFDLDEDKYHAALALSASGIKWLRVSTLDWWARSPLNTDPDDEEDSDAKVIGTAWHKRIVEGRDAFYARYAAAIDPHDYPEAIRTNEELKAAIEKAGGPTSKFSAMRKPELIERLLQYVPDAVIWEQVLTEHAMRHVGRECLSAKLIRKIEISAKMIEAHRDLGKAFTGGMPEVSVFWVDGETGVPMKARFDYWKARAIVDLKSFDPRGKPIDAAIARSVATYKYHIQCRFYLNAVAAAKRLINEGRVRGSAPADFLLGVCAGGEPTFLFVFSAKGPAPLARGKVLGPGAVMDIARQEIAEAKIKWARCWQTFGSDRWVDTASIATFDDHEFPVYLTE